MQDYPYPYFYSKPPPPLPPLTQTPTLPYPAGTLTPRLSSSNTLTPALTRTIPLPQTVLFRYPNPDPYPSLIPLFSAYPHPYPIQHLHKSQVADRGGWQQPLIPTLSVTPFFLLPRPPPHINPISLLSLLSPHPFLLTYLHSPPKPTSSHHYLLTYLTLSTLPHSC